MPEKLPDRIVVNGHIYVKAVATSQDALRALAGLTKLVEGILARFKGDAQVPESVQGLGELIKRAKQGIETNFEKGHDKGKDYLVRLMKGEDYLDVNNIADLKKILKTVAEQTEGYGRNLPTKTPKGNLPGTPGWNF